MRYITDKLEPRYHNALISWQKKHFKDYDYLVENWSRFYEQKPFQLVAKIGELKNNLIEVGKYAGRPKFEKSSEMDEDMIEKALNIIKAQASTELGSIQQHRETVTKIKDPKLQFDVLRVMAEEFRHAYQMVYVLSSDEWPGNQNPADIVIEQLLTMETGSHVLEAFNLYFDSFLDNIVFAALIDRVGKYQLTMQQVFAYAPMAKSMKPMLVEEAFHLATGVNPLRKWAVEAMQGKGDISVEEIQKYLNKWLPRGLEMFGDERGGKSNIDFGFKDKLNAKAQDDYYNEVKQAVINWLNYEVIRVKIPTISKSEAAQMADEIINTKIPKNGIYPQDLLYIPSKKFFRRRGLYAYEMNDVNGNKIEAMDKYLLYMKNVLPDKYIKSNDFKVYIDNLNKHNSGKEINEGSLPFYG